MKRNQYYGIITLRSWKVFPFRMTKRLSISCDCGPTDLLTIQIMRNLNLSHRKEVHSVLASVEMVSAENTVLGPYCHHFMFFVTLEWPDKLECLSLAILSNLV